MASIRSTIDLIITGSTRGLNAAAAEARRTAERIAAAEDRVAEARRRSAEAESRVADVEARLAGARARHTAALNQIGVAETRLEALRANSAIRTSRLGEAEAELARVRQNGTSEQIEAAERRIAQVRQEADLGARQLQAAEAQLERARANATARAGEITALEERLAQARGRAFRESEALAQAEERLRLIRRRGTDDINRQRDGILGIFDAFGRLAQAFSGADGASTSLLAKMAALNSVFSSIGGPIVQAVIGILEIIAVMGALGEIVGVVGGLIGQALAGVPALLLAIGAAAGTVALGMDGIKKAAEVITPAFDQLKRDVSEVFVRQLTPAFRDLAAALPKLTDGFRFIAVALSNMAQQVIGFVTSARGIEVINGILRGTATLFSSMAPGIRTFVQGLLEAANVGKTAFESLGTAIGSVFGRIGEVFSRLAADGIISRAVQGLAATLKGLGDVAAPIVEIFLRMGAALGETFGSVLTRLGGILQSTIPFFEKLADVAGRILKAAFDQLGPVIEKFFGGTIPGANAALDQFANFIINTVLPKIREFTEWLLGPGLAAIRDFVLNATASFLEFVSSVLTAISQMIPAVSGVLRVLSVLTGDPSFAQAAAAIDSIKVSVDGLNATVKSAQSKIIAFTVQVPSDRTTGEQGVLGVAAAMDRAAGAPKSTAFTVRVPSDRTTGEQGILGVAAAQERVQNKTVTTTANVPSGPTQGAQGNLLLEGAIGAVINKSVTTTSTVPGTPVLGTQGNQALSGAIGAVNSKTVTTQGNVPGSPTQGTQGNQALKGAIDNVKDKTVTVQANVNGTSAVQELVGWIGRVVGKTVDVVTNVITNFISGGRAAGGPVSAGKTYLVGERGPELITLGHQSGFVTNASRTRQVLNNRSSGGQATTEAGGGGQPITVNVLLSPEYFAELARVEIKNTDRAVKRTVLAGSGVTF